MQLKVGDSNNRLILNKINLINVSSDMNKLNLIYGFLWANCNIINNYYNFSPKDSIIGKIVRLLFTKNQFTNEITNSKTHNLPKFIRDETLENTTKTHTLGIIIGLIYMKSFVNEDSDYLKLDYKHASNNNTTSKANKTYVIEFNDKVLNVLNIEKNTSDDVIHDIINVLLALVLWNATDIEGIRHYYIGLNTVLPDKEKIKIPDIFYDDNNYFAKTIKYVYDSVNNPDTIILTPKKFIIFPKKISKYLYLYDTAETTIRSLINIAIFDNDTFNIETLKSMGAIDPVINYYKKYNTISLQSLDDAHKEWVLIVSNLDGVKYLNETTDGYKYHIESGFALDNKTVNLLHAITKILINVKDWNDITGLKFSFDSSIIFGKQLIVIKDIRRYVLHLDNNIFLENISDYYFEVKKKITFHNDLDKLYYYGILGNITKIIKITSNWPFYIYKINDNVLHDIIYNYNSYNHSENNTTNELSANILMNILCHFNYFNSDVYDRIFININLLRNATYYPEYKDKLVKYGILFDDKLECKYENIVALKIQEVVLKPNKLPPKLQTLKLGWHRINKVVLSANYRTNVYKEYENYPINNTNILPKTLKELYFGQVFNQPINKDSLPEGLKKLHFGDFFDQPINKDSLPEGLQELYFGMSFKQKIDKGCLPEGLQILHFGLLFNKPIDKGSLPKGLQILHFGFLYNQPIVKDSLPEGLKTLRFGDEFNKNLKPGMLPNSIETLIMPNYTTQVIGPDILPLSLKKLCLNKKTKYTIYVYKEVEDINPSQVEQIIIKSSKICFIHY